MSGKGVEAKGGCIVNTITTLRRSQGNKWWLNDPFACDLLAICLRFGTETTLKFVLRTCVIFCWLLCRGCSFRLLYV